MDMSMSGMSTGSATPTMAMAMSTTGTGMAAMASSTGMHSMSMGGSCKISMLWNWYTVDSCFIAKSWHITSKGMFAGSCIGVILLVVVLEFLRRAGKEYDRFIVSQHTRSLASSNGAVTASTSSTSSHDGAKPKAPTTSAAASACHPAPQATFRPNVLQQAIRALLHMLQFAVAYFIMLLAMYYNGYIIICIFIGAYIGYFIFGWESFKVGGGASDRLQEEVTVCCG
ncbi:Ctr-domain-containing protein [Lindgomyces ingoldianus]|uniref:Ctr-domain-containing protein n=1 Tax=Lindgomyces ingoldianus TaxID=673940 RepID=A0ACB6RGU3_9PLEO|nr:Ctr-domain-containing protein [Lindgomyces ingoldianus]KAF2477696.1 Ctr-domain-containing protein [Lindgomyces ingoldianus]